MAQLTLTLDNSDVDRVVSAFERRFGEWDPSVETKAEFLRRHIQMAVDRLVIENEREQAREMAESVFVPPVWL